MTRFFSLLTVVTFIGCAGISIDDQYDIGREAIIGDAGIFAIGSPDNPTAMWQFILEGEEEPVFSLAPKWEGFAWAVDEDGNFALSDNPEDFVYLTFYEVGENEYIITTDEGFYVIIGDAGRFIVGPSAMVFEIITDKYGVGAILNEKGLAGIIGDAG